LLRRFVSRKGHELFAQHPELPESRWKLEGQAVLVELAAQLDVDFEAHGRVRSAEKEVLELDELPDAVGPPRELLQ
jgi:hypothetical protein